MGELRTITVSLPSEMVKEVERLGNIEGKAPSELFREALRLYIRRKRWEVIREYGAKKASELGIKEEDLEEIIDDYRSESGVIQKDSWTSQKKGGYSLYCPPKS